MAERSQVCMCEAKVRFRALVSSLSIAENDLLAWCAPDAEVLEGTLRVPESLHWLWFCPWSFSRLLHF